MNGGLDAFEKELDIICCQKHDEQLQEYVDFVEKELTDYAEIKEMAEHYHFEDLANDVFKVETDRKWQLKFEAAICDFQKDYRKARAFDIIKEKVVQVGDLLYSPDLESYNKGRYRLYQLTQEEYYFLRRILL